MTEAERERYREALFLRRAGLTFKEIGQRIGKLNDPSKPISIERTRQLVYHGERLEAAARKCNAALMKNKASVHNRTMLVHI